MRKQAAGRHVAYDLYLTAYSDGVVHKRLYLPIAKNLVKKMAAGTYRKALAAKLFRYLVNDVAKDYYKSYGVYANPRTRQLAASYLLNQFENEVRDGSYREFVPKKYKGRIAVKRLANTRRAGVRVMPKGKRKRVIQKWESGDGRDWIELAKIGKQYAVSSRYSAGTYNTEESARKHVRRLLAEYGSTTFRKAFEHGGVFPVDEFGANFDMLTSGVKRRKSPVKRRKNPTVEYTSGRGFGKFSNSLEEFLYHQAGTGADEEIGSVDELGWFGLLTFKDDPLIVANDGKREKFVAAIISEDSQGFVDHETYKTMREARAKWEGINRKYSRFYREME